MYFQPSADSFGIRLLGLRCSWWHSRQANDVIASERSIFSENRGEPVHTYISGSRCAWWQKTMNRQTDTHTNTHGTTTVTLTAHALRGLIMCYDQKKLNLVFSEEKKEKGSGSRIFLRFLPYSFLPLHLSLTLHLPSIHFSPLPHHSPSLSPFRPLQEEEGWFQVQKALQRGLLQGKRVSTLWL